MRPLYEVDRAAIEPAVQHHDRPWLTFINYFVGCRPGAGWADPLVLERSRQEKQVAVRGRSIGFCKCLPCVRWACSAMGVISVGRVNVKGPDRRRDRWGRMI